MGSRANRPSRLAQAATRLEIRKWPAPVIRLYLGQTTAAEVLAAADDRDPMKKKKQVCAANFHIGALALPRGDKGEAARLFGLAASDCPRDYPEWRGATAELKALGLAGPAASVQPLR